MQQIEAHTHTHACILSMKVEYANHKASMPEI